MLQQQVLSKQELVVVSPAYEGKASYSFAANDVTGKVWVAVVHSDER